jgi:thermostable 8-oxoguanine DNA glycosylase
MVDPVNITNYNLTDAELEEHILFWVLAAGKNGHTAAKSLNKLMLILNKYDYRPLEAVRLQGLSSLFNKEPKLSYILKDCGIGCYNNKAYTINDLSMSVIAYGLDLRTCATEDLEKIHGIGMKTSRCFILHSRKDARYAGLDTHILKHLREVGIENAPKATPSSKKLYLTLEKEFLLLADKAGMSPADYDLKVWRHYSK